MPGQLSSVSINVFFYTNMIKKTTWIIFKDYIRDSDILFQKRNDTFGHHRNTRTLITELYKIKKLAPQIMDYTLHKRNITNISEIWRFLSKKKIIDFKVQKNYLNQAYFRRKSLREETISIFKSDVIRWICKGCSFKSSKVFKPNLGFTWHIAPTLLLFII